MEKRPAEAGPTTALTLAAAEAIVEIVPDVGGAIASFRWRGHDVLRPTPTDARVVRDVRRHACYPLVPYSNRIANATLRHGGRDHALARNFGDSPHAIHGVGWQRAWTTVAAASTSAQIALDHDASGDDASAWPWPFRATQTFTLRADDRGATLSARLAIENTGAVAFPFGLGWHPFFPKPLGTTLAFDAASVWLNDATQLPVERVAVPADWHYATARPLGEVVLDHVFEPSTGTATIAWPDAGVALTIVADSALDRRIVYVPAGRDFLAFEPATHMTDAFNRAARGQPDTGTRRLPPGAAFSCTMRLNATEPQR
ncbi:MAG TPA: aldose 1-epimerase [Casimicrobiaceae bacterium]|jgi:aldose 1-epimerase